MSLSRKAWRASSAASSLRIKESLLMRGDRIVKIRNSSADAGTLSTLEASVLARAIASSRVTAHD